MHRRRSVALSGRFVARARRFVATRWRGPGPVPRVQGIDHRQPTESPMSTTRTATQRIAAFALASITTLSVLAGVAGMADRSYAEERVAHDAAAAVQQVVVVPARSGQI